MWSDPAHDLGAVIGPSFFSADGMQVIAGRYWTDPNVKPPDDSLGVMIWDAHTGTLVRRIDVGPCGGAVTAVAEGRLLVRSPTPGSDGRTECHWPVDPNGPAVVSVDLATGASQVLADRALLDSFDGPGTDGGTLSGDGRFAGLDVYEAGTVTSVVVEISTGKRVFEIDPRTVQARFGPAPLAGG